MKEQKAAVHRRQNRQNNNFEDGDDQEDEWPEVDVNNLIIDLDIDIEKDIGPDMSGKTNKTGVLKEKDNDKAVKIKMKRSKESKSSGKISDDRVEIIGESRELKNPQNEKSGILNGLKVSSRPVPSMSSLVRSITTSTPTTANSLPMTQFSTAPGVGVTNGLRPPFPPGYRPPMPPHPPGAPGYGGGPGSGVPPRPNSNLSQQARLSLYGGSALREALEQPPLKRLKLEATTMTDAATITEPESLGPCEPGTAVTLEGIVWHETMEGILVVNVTWRGKTYVGTLLDCARHSNQWSAPRFTESPPPKGKRGKRGARNPSPEIEMTVAKNLRSRKGQPNEGFAVPASPAKEGIKRKKDTKDGKSKKAKLAKVKQEEDEEIKIVTSDDNDEKPVVIDEIFECPQPNCFKKYKAQSGLKYHISHAHSDTKPEKDGINGVSGVKSGNKKDKESGGSSDSSGSQPSSAATSPSPDELDERHRQNGAIVEKECSGGSSGMPKRPASPNGSKSIVSNQNHGSKNNNSSKGSAPVSIAPTGKTDIPLKNIGPKPIRPPLNARPIVPAQAPRPAGQLAASHMAPNLKPIQPKPTILPDPTPNVSFDDLKKKKEPKKKSPKINGKGGQSPKSVNSDVSVINSPTVDVNPDGSSIPDKASGHTGKSTESRNAYSDISDDNEDMDKKCIMSRPREGFPGCEHRMQISNLPNQLSQGHQPQGQMTPTKDSVSMPSVGGGAKGSISSYKPDQKEISTGKEDNKSGEDKVNEGKKVVVSGPPAGTPEYYRMLEAYGFPPYPYPFPNGMDPNYHLHLLATDPNYKVKFEKDREEKARAFKDQIDKDNREKDLKTGVKVPTNISSFKSEDSYKTNKPDESGKVTPKLPRSLSPMVGGPTISVKAEFRTGKDPEAKKESAAEEGAKPTMETRGPPPGPQTYGFMSAAPFIRPPYGAPQFDPRHPMFASPNPMQMLGSPYGHHPGHPYFSPHLQAAAGVRPPYPDSLLRPPSAPEDLSRANGSKALEMLQQHATQYYANNHKIHELQGSGTKSPVSQGSPTPVSISGKSTALNTGKDSRLGTPSPVTKEKPSPPPPFRHEHTHTHLHLGYPLPLPGVPPPAHSTPMSSPPYSSAR